MLVRELIEKLQACPPDAPVCWDAHDYDHYYGGTIEVEKSSYEEVLESLEDQEIGANFPRDLTCVVKLS